MALGPSPTLTGHMYSDVLYSLTIGFVGAILFLLVDKYEPEGPLARLLKFLILFVAGVAILHKLQPTVWLALVAPTMIHWSSQASADRTYKEMHPN